MLKDGFLRFCDDPEIACCKAEHELGQLRDENAQLKTDNTAMRLEWQEAHEELKQLRTEIERYKGNTVCDYCEDGFKFWQAEISGSLPNVKYCPMCGRLLREVQP